MGSFLNMYEYRLARKYKLIKSKKFKIDKNRSYCDYCGKQLSWYENVPVVSWVFQRGVTKCCGKKLPIQYPLLEISTGVAFLIFNLKFLIFNQFSIIQFLIGLIIISLLIFSFVFDLKYMVLPDKTNLALVIIALIFYRNNILIGVGTTLFFFILNRIKIRGGEAMGMGDVKYSLFMGLFLGWPNILVAIYFAFIVGAVVSIFLLSFKIVKKEMPIPFGPFLIVGTVVAKLYGSILYEKIWFYFS